MTQAAALVLPVDAARKGRLKLRGLTEEIAGFARACQAMRGVVAPGPSVEFEDLDPVVNALDRALVSIRTLDLEVLASKIGTPYEDLRRTDPQGVVVRGLTGPRNNAVHHLDVIDPDVARAIGPVDGSFVILPRWRPRAEVPVAMFLSGGRNPKSSTALESAYDAVAGRLVLDTLFDAFAFFARCAPSLVDRDESGQIKGFAIAPLSIVAGYTRLHPDWPSHEEADAQVRGDLASATPDGNSRKILGCFESEDGWVLYGYTDLDTGRGHVFTELASQVIKDVAAGFRYVVTDVAGAHDVVLLSGNLAVAGVPLDFTNLPWPETDSRPWIGWWNAARDHADLYRSQRRPR